MKLIVAYLSRASRLGWSLGLLLIAVNAFSQTPATAGTADTEYEVGAVLWQQSSGEERALAYQAFTLARMVLERDLRIHRQNRMKPALIVDIDETILDNSRHEAWLIKNHRAYNSKDWTDWCTRAEATAVPGAVEFLRYATSRGVRVFYVTNREQKERDGTLRNLKAVGFPEVNDATLLTRTDPNSTSKEPRRRSIASHYRVILLMGDDLNDFAEVFEQNKTATGRIEAADKNKAMFGTRFIVLPNPMYGDWESAAVGNTSQLSQAEKAAKRRLTLKD